MKRTWTIIPCAVISLMLAACAGMHVGSNARPTDELAISRIADNFAAAWNRHDMNALAELCTEDADFVVITGQHLKGREEIFTYHDALHKTIFKDRTLSAKLSDLRFLSADVAIGHLKFEGSATSGDERRRTTAFATIVVVKERGNWLISAFHNTLRSGPSGGVLPQDKDDRG